VLLLAFVTIEARSDHPILPFRLLADRNRAASYLVMLGLAGSRNSQDLWIGVSRDLLITTL